jgi:hypothetical protein
MKAVEAGAQLPVHGGVSVCPEQKPRGSFVGVTVPSLLFEQGDLALVVGGTASGAAGGSDYG